MGILLPVTNVSKPSYHHKIARGCTNLVFTMSSLSSFNRLPWHCYPFCKFPRKLRRQKSSVCSWLSNKKSMYPALPMSKQVSLLPHQLEDNRFCLLLSVGTNVLLSPCFIKTAIVWSPVAIVDRTCSHSRVQYQAFVCHTNRLTCHYFQKQRNKRKILFSQIDSAFELIDWIHLLLKKELQKGVSRQLVAWQPGILNKIMISQELH